MQEIPRNPRTWNFATGIGCCPCAKLQNARNKLLEKRDAPISVKLASLLCQIHYRIPKAINLIFIRIIMIMKIFIVEVIRISYNWVISFDSTLPLTRRFLTPITFPSLRTKEQRRNEPRRTIIPQSKKLDFQALQGSLDWVSTAPRTPGTRGTPWFHPTMLI